MIFCGESCTDDFLVDIIRLARWQGEGLVVKYCAMENAITINLYSIDHVFEIVHWSVIFLVSLLDDQLYKTVP